MPNMPKPCTKRGSTATFVVGAPRSGTTLVGMILDRHSDFVTPGETHFFEDIWARRAVLGELKNEAELLRAADQLLMVFGRFHQRGQKIVDEVIRKNALVDRAMRLGGGYDSLYLAFMNALAESQGRRCFCDDTPRHLFHMATIFTYFPDAKAIGCVRDPRDFLCSYKNYHKIATETDRIKSLYHPVITSLLWRGSANLLAKYSHQYGSARMHVVRYESLVQYPEQEVRRICDFLDIEYSPRLIEIETHNSSFQQPSAGIYTDSVGRWRTHLSAEEIWWSHRLNMQGMLRFGYAPEPVKPAKERLLVDAVSTPWALVRALRVNAHRQGPIRDYVRRRFAAMWDRSA